MPDSPADTPRPMRRVALLVEYDGTSYHGVQRQENTRETIQEYLENAARSLGSLDPAFIASGRTDAGVHALGQVVAVTIPEKIEERRLALAFNHHLPNAIRVRRAAVCAPDFSPRLDARKRTYIYRFTAAETVPPLFARFVAYIGYQVDPELIQQAAAAFVGRWELCEWRSSICQAERTLLTIDECLATPPAPDTLGEIRRWWEIRVRARSFLHHQVRFMAGGVIAVGSGRLPLEELKSALAAGKRPTIVKKESAVGLCMTHVEFAEGRDPFASQ